MSKRSFFLQELGHFQSWARTLTSYWPTYRAHSHVVLSIYINIWLCPIHIWICGLAWSSDPKLPSTSASNGVFVRNYSYGYTGVSFLQFSRGCEQFTHFHANQTRFDVKSFVWRLVLKQRHKVTWKWSIFAQQVIALSRFRCVTESIHLLSQWLKRSRDILVINV